MKSSKLFSSILIFALILFGVRPSTSHAQSPTIDLPLPEENSLNIKRVGQLGGMTGDLFASGDYVYAAIGPRLAILDISNPAAPVEISRTNPFPGDIGDIFVNGTTLYMIANGTFYILDVSNPQAPSLVHYPEPASHYPGSIYVVGNLAYLTGPGAFWIVDVSDPSHPVELGSYEYPYTPDSGWINLGEMVVQGDLAYAVSSEKGLIIFDVSDPIHPMEISHLATEYAISLDVEGSKAYVGNYSAGVSIIDISDPTQPSEVAKIPSWLVWDLDASGTMLYVSNLDTQFSIWDTSNPVAPVELSTKTWPWGGSNRKIQVVDDLAFVSTWSGLTILDVHDRSAPQELFVFKSYLNSISSACGLAVQAGKAYVPDAPVVDVSDPTNPHFMSENPLPPGNTVKFAGSTAYIPYPGGTHIVDVSDPANPVLTGHTYSATDAFVQGTYLYLVYGSKLTVLDIHDPETPVDAGYFDQLGNGVSLSVAGAYVYIADYLYGLRILDVSDPTNIVERGSLQIPGYNFRYITLTGQSAYIDIGGGGYIVVDVSNPAAPVQTSRYDTWEGPNSLYVLDALVYFSASELSVLDSTDPNNIQVVGSYPINACGMAYDAGLIYIRDVSNGLNILRYTPGPLPPPDTDGDGHADDIDNAPDYFNPDQSDLDKDGVGDVIDPCPSDLSNHCDTEGSAAASIGRRGGEVVTPDGSTSILVPEGALPGRTSISITDLGSGFTLDTDAGPATAISGVEIGPPGTSFNQPVTIMLSWPDADQDGIVDGAGQNEGGLFVSKDGVVITGLCSEDPGCDAAANTFSVQVTSLSIFAVAWLNNQPPVAEAGGPYAVLEGSTVTLDASGSFDPDQDSLDYAWDLDGDGTYDDASGASTGFLAVDDGLYAVGLQVSDPAGARATDSATVVVSNAAPTILSIQAPLAPVRVGTPVSVSAAIRDPGLRDTHQAVWDWGNGVATTTDANGPVATGVYTYPQPGVYAVGVTVTDDDGGAATAAYDYIVVYDPLGGFATGGGWFHSPAGAYKADPAMQGKFSLGFVGKIKPGSSVPTGNLEMQLHSADFNFSSETYQWLVINADGTQAIFKGSGTINGEQAPTGPYSFMVWMQDGRSDSLRIKVWWMDGAGVEHVVYESGGYLPLGGGNLVVHR